MNSLFEAALEIQNFIRAKQWRFCIIGGLAVVRWGQPRATQDVDISLLTEFGREEHYVNELLKQFEGRIPDARGFALESRVVLAKAGNGVSLDIALAGFPYEKKVIDRASSFAFAPGVELTTASGEDLVVLKSFAGRDQDWADVKGILERQGGQLEWAYIRRELGALGELTQGDDPLQRLEEIRRRAEEDFNGG